MGIGYVLKEARINAGMSVKEVSAFLIEKGFKASDKTIYSWENDNSKPAPEILLVLCDLYRIKDILKTFGYDNYSVDEDLALNTKEIEMIEHYRSLDSHGKEIVDFVLHKEWERSTSIFKN